MLDSNNRQTLIEKLRGKIKKASSNISSKFELEKGDFKISLTPDSIDQFYKGNKVGSIKIAQLEPEMVELINSDEDAAQEMLMEFANSYNPNLKEAANSAVNEETATIITQKQLDDNKVKLHPRTEEYPNVITQKQLPNNNKRPGTYNEITEGQFTNERKTFYGEARTSGDWKQEDRSTVTEKQLDDKATEYSEQGISERGENGVEFDGGSEKQQRMIGEKQLEQLLTHHEWTEPFTTTEGKDQLGKQTGELARLTAEKVIAISKLAYDVLGKTVISTGITPKKLASIVNKLFSHPSKYPVLADTINKYKGSSVESIINKVANAKYFGKTAYINTNPSDLLVSDVMVRQLSNADFNSKDIVKVVSYLSKEANFEQEVANSIESLLNSTSDVKLADSDPDLEVIKSALHGPVVKGNADNDGMYMYVGKLSEVNADPSNQEEFAQAASKYAETKVRSSTKVASELIPLDCAVHEDKNIFEVRFQDSSFVKPELEARAAKRREMAKEASVKTAQMPTGGMPPAGDPAMGNPQAPAGPGGLGGGAGAPPGEALSQSQPPPPVEPELEESKGEPKPPGSTCPSCGATDVNLEKGEFKCNNCGTEGKIHVSIDVTKWTGTLEDKEEDKGGIGVEDAGLGAQEEEMAGSGVGAGEGEGTTLPTMPVAASVKVTPLMLQKLSEQKIRLGNTCPNCGSHNTSSVKSASYKGEDCICWDCLQESNFQIKAEKGKKNSVYAQWTWIPKTADDSSCSDCNRLATAFKQSLSNYGMGWEEFDKLSMIEQANVVVKMAKTNTLDIETAMVAPISLNKYAASPRWKGYEKFDKFPTASCVERLSRRFGENATAMSGPCKGTKLANCVCSQLKNLGIYNDGLAAKVASAIGNPDPVINNPSETCAQMLIKSGFEIKEACIACDGLRAAYASNEDLIVDAISQIDVTAQMLGADIGAGIGEAAGGTFKGIGQGVGSALEGAGAGIGGAAKGIGEGINSVQKDQNRPKPLEDNPMDEPVSDFGGESELGGEESLNDDFALNFGDNMGEVEGGDLDLGLGGDVVTIKLPSELKETLKTLLDAIQGQISDDMIDVTGEMGEETPGLDTDVMTEDESLPVETTEITEVTSEPNGDDLNINDVKENTENLEDTEDTEDTGIPGVSESEDGGLVKDSDPEDSSETEDSNESETKECPCSPMKKEPEKKEPESKPHDLPFTDKTQDKDSDETSEHSESKEHKSHKEESKEAEASSLRQTLYKMKTGTISKSASSLDSLVEGLLKQAAKNDDVVKVKREEEKSSKITVKPSQDSKEIGKIQDNGKIGGEKPFKDGVKMKPDVPRGDALMGEETSENKVSETGDLPTIPHGKGSMEGEENYKPEDGNVVDGNQGGQKVASTKVAKCNCGDSSCSCNCNKKECGHPCKTASNKNNEKTAEKIKENADKNTNSVNMSKEAQATKLKNVKKLEDDPDINQSSGAGKGKVKADETHSLAVDEKKPSEGMSEPSVPEAPNKGRLSREHSVEVSKDLPEIPTGGGMNPEYDQNEKNKPEKVDEILGKQNDVALAEHKNKAIKIASRLLKANKISIDEMPDKLAELMNASPAILNDYDKLLSEAANSNKGMQKAAQSGAVENMPLQPTSPNVADKNSNLKQNIAELFTLQHRNKEFERYSDKYGN